MSVCLHLCSSVCVCVCMCKGVNVCVEESLGMLACTNVPLQLSCVCTSVGLEKWGVWVLLGGWC